MFSARGAEAELRAGYQLAARLGQWSLAQDEVMGEAWTVEAAGVTVDRFWLTHGDLTLVLRLGRSTWHFAVASYEETDGGLRLHGEGRPTVIGRSNP